jgi:AbrB family looped-hinge helix DNA binding protein
MDLRHWARGQVVIPADARKDCDIHPGDKLLVFRHPQHKRMLILAKVGEMQQFLQQVAHAVEVASAHLSEEEDGSQG